ncbi:metallophosphoesterase [Acuticoccus sp. M5D2P5]|uniref:metallophosphoesterase family protein n=1 Tax=Acuticoccus kalidii TaxID=2910977 RepID=UPI001F360A6C|nr:metallophosphoesterase [Acuticoccus kalidii]MCF3933553.1 metallophosphoesterase [Acuticoccus kalidii]
MTRLAHISDLHFGSEDPETTAALIDELNREEFDLVILSGDLTMAARHSEFERARAFIEALESPVIAVPGNHDITPYALGERFFAPYRRWHSYVNKELEPSWFGRHVAVIGLNTARRMALRLDWSHGSLSRSQIEELSGRFKRARDSAFRIVVAHHPFIAEDTEELSDRPRVMVRRAQQALAAFAGQKVDLVTAGHLHRTYSAAFDQEPHGGSVVASRTQPGQRVTVIQAGTALSSRTRGEPNSFNRIEIDGSALTVHPVTFGPNGWERDAIPLVSIERHTHSEPAIELTPPKPVSSVYAPGSKSGDAKAGSPPRASKSAPGGQ